jgi:hypothetical protein
MSVLHRSIELLEPYDGKLSCTVLRGESARKGADLPDPPKPQLYSHYESDTTDDVDVLIMKICSHGIDITSNYKDWFAIGCAFASEFGEEGRIRFHYISSQSSKYNENKCNKQYDNCIKWVVDKRTSIGIFFNYCKLYGVTKGMNNPD